MLNGIPLPVPLSPAAPSTIHTLDAATTINDGTGRPYMDVLSLYLQNSEATNPAIVDVVFNPPGGAPVTLSVSVPAGEVVRVFDETAFGGIPLGSLANPPLGGASITVQLQAGVNLSVGATAWGWFTRS